MARIFLVRHGQTAWNKELIFRGRKDLPLSEFGLRQAEAVADGLAGEPIAAVSASPMVRAVQTVTPLAERLGLPVTPAPGMIDADFGEWEGKTIPEVQAAWPDLFALWTTAPHRVAFPGGETFRGVAERSLAALRTIARDAGESTVAVCGHRFINKVVLCGLLEIVESGFWRIKQDTACINVLEIAGDKAVVERTNDTHHLAPLNPKREVDF
jgi:phosphoserine phosphatase